MRNKIIAVCIAVGWLAMQYFLQPLFPMGSPYWLLIACLAWGSAIWVFLLKPKNDIKQNNEISEFNINVDTKLGEIWGSKILSAINIKNNSCLSLDDCIVQIEEIDNLHNDMMPLPFVLRTEGQLRGRRKGRFKLSPKQVKRIPIMLKINIRRDEWYFIDENEKQYYTYPSDIRMLIGIHGGEMNKRIIMELTKLEGWKAETKIYNANNNYSLG